MFLLEYGQRQLGILILWSPGRFDHNLLFGNQFFSGDGRLLRKVLIGDLEVSHDELSSWEQDDGGDEGRERGHGEEQPARAVLSPITLVATRVESLPSYHTAGLISHAGIQIHKHLVLYAFD